MPKRDLAAEMDTYESGVATKKNEKAYSFQGTWSKLGCGGKCLKWYLLVMNFFFLIFGFVLLVVAAYAMTSSFSDLLGHWFTPVVIVAAAVILLGITGIGGAAKEWRLVLYVYSLVLGIMFLCVLILSIYAVTQKGNEANIVTPAWKVAPPDVLNRIQNTYSCCGLWPNTSFPNLSCPNVTNAPACGPLIVEDFQSAYTPIGIAGVTLGFLLFSGLLGSALLACAITDSQGQHQS